MVDFTVSFDGSIGLVYPQTRRARDFLEGRIAPDAQWFGRGLVVEHRYLADLVDALRAEGYEVNT